VSHAAAHALLYHLKLTAPGIMRLGGAGNGALLQAAHSLGGQPQPCDQWLVRITNMAALLTRLAPLFERKLLRVDAVLTRGMGRTIRAHNP
jgi:hypothetical protein